MKIVTAQEMRDLDAKAIARGVPSLTLMENAGRCVVSAMESVFGNLRERTVTVVCGKGNNGGDGLVAARLLQERGATVRVWLLAEPADLRGDAGTNLGRWRAAGGSFVTLTDTGMQAFEQSLDTTDFIIDAILGTGLSSPVGGLAARAVEVMGSARRHRTRIIAVDLPSGLDADTGRVSGAAVPADLTVTFGLPKRGHFFSDGPSVTGRLEVADIGIPAGLVREAAISLHLDTANDLGPRIIQRPPDSHKGTSGHVLIVAGAVGTSGAAVLAGLGALRAGAGLVTLAAPRSVEAALHPRPPELMTLPLPETPDQTLSGGALDPLLGFAKKIRVIGIGPGLSHQPQTSELVREFIARAEAPMVIDADALNALAGHLEILKRSAAPRVLTPHPGEMSRLCGRDTREIRENRLDIARDFARKWGVILVLKGVHTVTALPGGEAYVNSTGNPGLATAGTGDVLTGVIAGLIAQGYEPGLAARLGVFIHGLAGDRAARTVGPVGFIATDVAARIPEALASIIRNETRREKSAAGGAHGD